MSDIPQYAFKAEDMIKNGRTSRANIDEIKKWLSLHPVYPPMADEQIVLFLIACNNVIEATENTIECYFKHKANSPELFRNRDLDSEETQLTMSVSSIAPLPEPTKDNYATVMWSLKDTYYNKFNVAKQFKMGFVAVDGILHSNPPNGLIVIVDTNGVGLMHITRIKLDVIKKVMAYLQEALPTQLKQIHILNASYVFDKILFILKPFMKKELFDLIIIHSSSTPMEEFFEKYVPARCMPCDFGGELPTLEELSKNFQVECRKVKKFFEADENQIQRYMDNLEGC